MTSPIPDEDAEEESEIPTGSDVITPFDRCFHASIKFKDFPALGAALMAPDADLNKIYRKKTPLILAIQVEQRERERERHRLG